MHPAEKFIQARDLLLANRENYAAAYEGFQWPVLKQFNWALDYFDVYAQNNQRPALWVVNDGGSESRLTFAELSERSNRAANFLKQAGVRRGDRVLVMLPNVVPLWEITLAALNSGYLVEYVEVDYYARTGKSKIRPIQDTWNFFMLIIRLTLIFRPLKVYLPIALGLFLAAAGIVAVGWFGFGKIFDNTALIFLFAAFQALAIGFLADVVNVRRSRAPEK